MPEFFPRHTIEWRAHELRFPRRVSLSLIGMAFVTGLLVRFFRLLVLSNRQLSFWGVFPLFALGFVLLLGLSALYLGNHPVHQWLWRAPLFALLESVSEAVVSAVFIALGVERIGTLHAQWSNWVPMAVTTLKWRASTILLFALLLAFVVQGVRKVLIEHERGVGALHHE